MKQAHIESVLKEAGEKMWDNACEACARFVELSPGVPTEELAAGIRRLTFRETPGGRRPMTTIMHYDVARVADHGGGSTTGRRIVIHVPHRELLRLIRALANEARDYPDSTLVSVCLDVAREEGDNRG